MKRRELSALQGTLMSGNTPVAQIENGEISNVLEPTLLPFHFLHAEDPSLYAWIRQRCIDTNRTNCRFLLRELDLEEADSIQIVLSVNAAAITDHFWIREKGSDKTYEQIRFHQDHLAKTALLGSSAGIVVPRIIILPNSPIQAHLKNAGVWKTVNGGFIREGIPNTHFQNLPYRRSGNILA